MGRIVAAAAYCEGRRVSEISLNEGKEWAARPGHFVWIGIHAPDEAELKDLQRQFGLHELAIEDALHAHQRPKVETYGDTLFLVLRTAQRESGSVDFGETHIFAGQGFIISVRHGASTTYGHVRSRCEANPRMLSHGVDFVLHSIADFVIDNYTPVLEAIEREVVALEGRMLRRPIRTRDVATMYRLRGELLSLRRAAGPTALVCRQLEQLDFSLIDEAMRPYFRDVADHAQKTNDDITQLQELLDHTFEAGFLLEASRQNVVQRKFAAWAAILAVPTAVAGIYGMNFEHMPELSWRYGYFLVLGSIITTCVSLYVSFKRADWL